MFLSRCINSSNNTGIDPRGQSYAGSLSCRKCHQSIYDSYITTVHFNTTKQALKETVRGSFITGQNDIIYNSQTKVAMEQRDSELSQVLYINGKEKEAHRFDVVFGVKKAQTFLYWRGNKTFELPVSYYASINGWATSPGFAAADANFNRFIGKNCFECHSSYIDSKLTSSASGMDELLDKRSLIYGIDCERCHGPAINHVEYHLNNPGEKSSKYIVSYHSLNRQQQLDACAVCHSGNDREQAISIFKFKMRDTLSNFFLHSPNHSYNKSADVDVHGNQYQLLAASKCFAGSKVLTCVTCHNPHSESSSDLKSYSEKCISCHKTTHDNGIPNIKFAVNKIKGNCIDCHMPKMSSTAISFYTSGNSVKSSYQLRTHKIAVYKKNDTKNEAVIALFSKNKNRKERS